MKFDPIAVLTHKARLCCNSSLSFDGKITALVEGIVVGERQVDRSFVSGDLLDIPITYFPSVNLPAKIRFVKGDEEIATPLTMATGEDVMTMLGHGDLVVENLFLDGSLLRGTIVNRTNGAYAPSVYIRINGQIVRSAAVDPSRARDEGGASCRFAVPIRPTDLTESGLSIDLHVTGIEYPVANLSYARADPTPLIKHLIETDEKLRQLQKSTFLQIEVLKESLDRQLTIQQERIDTFIEYAMSLMVDNLAGQSGANTPHAFADALKEFDSNTKNAQLTALSSPDSIHLEPDSPNFIFGWYDLEVAKGKNFRWMGQTGLVRNPHRSLPILRAELHLSRVYGADEPMLRAAIDDQDLAMTSTVGEDGFIVTLAAPPGRPITGESVHIESFLTGCPATDSGTSDTRILSVGITGMTFYYHNEDSENI